MDSTSADVDAHYILTDVPPGKYVLIAFPAVRVTDGSDVLGWRAEVDVSGGLRRQHLDNGARLIFEMFCPPGGGPPLVTNSN